MAIGILFESKEWSVYALMRHITAMGVKAKLFNLQEEFHQDEIFSCELIVNRVFASAAFRGHQKALAQTHAVIELLEKRAIPMINPAEAHLYEISKEKFTKALGAHGFPVPTVYGVFLPAQLKERAERAELEYPFIVKPDCGGRTNYTFIVNNLKELQGYMENAPEILFIAEEYLRPEYGYVTRLEIIDHSCKLVMKRSVTQNGLSAFRLGSTYTSYYDLPGKIRDTAIKAMDTLKVETGSMDIIENEKGFYIIDVNSVSNATEESTKMLRFDLMKETAEYIIKKHKLL